MKRSRARSPEAIEFARSQRAVANEFADTVWQWVRNRQICKSEVSPRVSDPSVHRRFLLRRVEIDPRNLLGRITSQKPDKIGIVCETIFSPGRATGSCAFRATKCCEKETRSSR